MITPQPKHLLPLDELLGLRREVERLQFENQHHGGLLDALLNQSPHGVIICDAHGSLILQNRAAIRIWVGGADADAVDAFARYRAFHPDGQPFLPGDWPMARCLGQGAPIDAEETRIRRSDGAHAILLGSSAPIYGADNIVNSAGQVAVAPSSDEHGPGKRVIGAVWVFADITPLKRTETALRLAEERLLDEQRLQEERRRFIAKASDELASSLDYQTTLATVARLAVPAIADWAAIDLVEANGTPRRVASAHVDPAMVERFAREKQRLPEGLDPLHAVEHVLGRRQPILVPDIASALPGMRAVDDGEPPVVDELGLRSFIGVPLQARGRVVGVISLVTSVSRRTLDADDLALAESLAQRAAVALDNARLYREAQEAVRSRDDLLAVVSHDLRNPLGTIAAAAGVIHRVTIEDEPIQSLKQVAIIERATRRMERLIRDLLDFASVEAGRLSLHMRPIETASLLAEALEMMEPLTTQKALRLELDGGAAEIVCDRDRILQVFSNLVGNAIKFTPERGSITITVAPRGEQVEFVVADTGPGIPVDQLPRIFDRYWQGKPTAGRGVGLGLAIAKGIVEAHHGRIWVESPPGCGTRVTFTVPAHVPGSR